MPSNVGGSFAARFWRRDRSYSAVRRVAKGDRNLLVMRQSAPVSYDQRQLPAAAREIQPPPLTSLTPPCRLSLRNAETPNAASLASAAGLPNRGSPPDPAG